MAFIFGPLSTTGADFSVSVFLSLRVYQVHQMDLMQTKQKRSLDASIGQVVFDAHAMNKQRGARLELMQFL